MKAPENTHPNAEREELVRAETLALLVQQSFPALFQSLLIAAVLCWTLWGRLDSDKLLLWLGLLSASSVIRLLMFQRYFRARPTGLAVLAWQWPYVGTLLLSSLVWGLGVVWLMPPDEALEQFVILFFVGGLVGGSMVTYSAHRNIANATMAAVLLPSVVWLFLQGSHLTLGLGVAAILFMIGALRGVRVLTAAMQSRLLLSYELQHANQIADRMARTDALTGINNRRAFMELGEQMSRLCLRQDTALSALLIDVDHFKRINDSHGHAAGDRVLAQVGKLLAQQFRASDICGRLGGEEFAVLLPDTDAMAAASIAEKLRANMQDVSILWNNEALRITVSIGVASSSDSLDTLLHRADTAMYQAKENGRNRIAFYGVESTPP